MKHGYYADDELPKSVALDREGLKNYHLNSYGYRCPEFRPLPDGGKNVVVLGCSHTFGEGLNEDETWVSQVAKESNKILRWWNLGQPGASADKIIRILYATEKVLFPKIIIVCWPLWSRRERLHSYPHSLMSYDPLLKTENDNKKNQAKTFHCFAQDAYKLDNNLQVLKDYTIKNCWPEWDRHHLPDAKRDIIKTPSLARDGVHYGAEHHQVFARLFLERFKSKLR